MPIKNYNRNDAGVVFEESAFSQQSEVIFHFVHCAAILSNFLFLSLSLALASLSSDEHKHVPPMYIVYFLQSALFAYCFSCLKTELDHIWVSPWVHSVLISCSNKRKETPNKEMV